MLAEDDENIRRRAVDKILELRSEASATTDNGIIYLRKQQKKDVVWQFKVPKINVEATHFYELTNLDSIMNISQPPAVMDLDDTSIALTQNNNLFETNILHTGPVVMVAQTLKNVLYGLTVCERQFYMYFDWFACNYAELG